ncbi:MAG: hypothetical protein DKT66_02670 [Candidatus Melainabacteria bacterium]|nr:MAG: hypothetical protein DKT66_02670 [Candidatus Melainabacteria bacterium]
MKEVAFWFDLKSFVEGKLRDTYVVLELKD